MKIEDIAQEQPRFVLEEFFLGRTLAWGIFEDRFGNIKRSFKVVIDGRMEQGQLILDEAFVYNDGATEQRIWRINALSDTHYEGRAADVLGVAQGERLGNALRWHYTLALKTQSSTWKLKFDDWMLQLEHGVMINRAHVSKWGIKVGSVSLFFVKPDAKALKFTPQSANLSAK